MSRVSSESLSQKRALFSWEDRVSRAIGRILQTGEYEVFLTKEGRLMTATTRDFLGLEDYPEERLGNVAYPSPKLGPGSTVSEAARLLHDYRLRAVPISEEGDLVRVVTAKAMLQAVLSKGQSIGAKLDDTMTKSVTSMDSRATASKAIALMKEGNFDHVPITDGGRTVGMLTSTDLLARMPPEPGLPPNFKGTPEHRFDYPVSNIAQEEVVTLTRGSSYLEAVKEMVLRNSSYVLVTESERTIGIATLRDMVKPLIAKNAEGLPFYVAGMTQEPFDQGRVEEKVKRMGESLKKTFPDLEEVRAIVKGGAHSRIHEVTLTVYTSHGLYSFSSEGHDLIKAVDELTPKVKKLLSSRRSRVETRRERALKERGPA
ncbi:MAG TPA: CBS domain-containing protein [Nitrososphaerales archaeon]|nr:CBS domain-containing protein [Nitrososphaerales archaeon]